MRVLSLFSGLGGLDLGFQQQGFEIVLAADSRQAAVDSYNQNLEPVARRLDLSAPDSGDLPEVDVVVGGPPCQSFSLLGRREPDDERGRLVFAFLDIVRHLRPSAFVMENVPGIVSSRVNGKRLVHVLVQQFEDAGYTVLRDTLVATDFLVPQKRRRQVLVGQRAGEPRLPDPSEFVRKVLGVEADDVDVSAAAAIGDLGVAVSKGLRSTYAQPPASAIANLLRDASASDVSLHEVPRMSDTDRRLIAVIPPGGNYQDVPDHLATPRILRFKETGGRTTTYGRLHPDRPAYTINTYFRRPNVGANFHYAQQRLITPREAMRFQSLPDSFELIFSSQDERNALIGNAVPAFLGRAIAWSLGASLGLRSASGRRLAARARASAATA